MVHTTQHFPRKLRGLGVVLLAATAAAACSSANQTKVDTTNQVPIKTSKGPVAVYDIAHKDATKNWDDGANGRCDPASGRIRIPMRLAPPCVPVFSGSNGGAQGIGVSADTIKVAYYVAKPDASADFLTKSTGAYDEPTDVAKTIKGYTEIFSKLTELYGRKVELVPLQGTGLSSDETAAKADAIKAKELGVFGVLGGPSQTRSFSQTLAEEHILCIGSCLIAQPASFYKETHPYVWPGISPDQTAQLNVEFVTKQLAGKNAEYGGDAVKDKKRSFVILNYDTKTGNFTKVWDDWEAKLKGAGVNIVDRVPYYLDVATVAQDAIPTVQKLKKSGATTILFTGDPFSPIYITKEMTKQGYFPEWVLAGTVFADTTVFSRQFDQQQWKHAFGMNLIPTRIPKKAGEAYKVYTCGLGRAPEADNTQGIILANVSLLMNGLTLAGPQLTPEHFRDGLWAAPLAERDAAHLRSTVSYGNHEINGKAIWPKDTDFGGTDDAALAWWDPTVKGEDETGDTKNPGGWRYLNNGARFLPGEIPTEPMGLFKKENTITYYSDTVDEANGILATPDALKPLTNGKCV